MMHESTLREIKTTYLGDHFGFVREELPVMLEPLTPLGVERKGSFDFVFEASAGERIGFEVLTRPSCGKLKKKLCYACKVDRYVFVLPHTSLGLYRKRKHGLFRAVVKQKSFPKEFSRPNLFAWMLDFERGVFLEKGLFSRLFNVQGNP